MTTTLNAIILNRSSACLLYTSYENLEILLLNDGSKDVSYPCLLYTSYNICEISHATGETALGEKLNVVSYRLQPKDTQNEALLLIDEVQNASSGETLYFTLHYGDFDTGEVTRAEVIYQMCIRDSTCRRALT